MARAFCVLLLYCSLCLDNVFAEKHAVILVYHHVANDTPQSTSISPKTFRAHLRYLHEQGFRVWPLSKVLDALAHPHRMEQKVVAITFDDAYASVYSNAFPALQTYNWPFTIFVSTDYLDKSFKNYMTWSQLRILNNYGAEVGNHSRSHTRLIKQAEEGHTDWQQRVTHEIQYAQSRISAELTHPALQILAYPYGEFDDELEKLVSSLAYAALGQQSGVAAVNGSITQIPRFPITAAYANLPAFSLRVHAQALPVTVLGDSARVLAQGTQPVLKLRIGTGEFERLAISCFATNQGPITVKWEAADTLSITVSEPLAVGRSKYTCTVKSRTDDRVFYWYSHLWIVQES